MTQDNDTLLRNLGEETIYTAKGHFKACDIRRNLMTTTIWICALLNLLGLFDFSSLTGKIMSGIGLAGTIGLLIWNEGEGKEYRSSHKKIAEKYLALHKEIRECFLTQNFDDDFIKSLNVKVRKLDQSTKPEIPWAAKYFAKKAIEKKGETDNWWKK